MAIAVEDRKTDNSTSEAWQTLSDFGAFDANLHPTPRWIRCNAAGTINLQDKKGHATGAQNVVTGELLKASPLQILSSGTTLTAANITLLF